MVEISKNFHCKNCSLRQTIFDSLTDDEYEIIDKDRYEVRYNAGETISKQGTALTHISCFTSGMAKVYIEGLREKNMIIEIVKAGDMIGGPGMYTDFRHHHTITALTETNLCQIDVHAFEQVVASNNVFAMALLKANNHRLSMSFGKFVHLTQKHMAGRMADALIYLADDIHNAPQFHTALSRQDLADMTAMTKESTIRILKGFREDNIIYCEGNHFEIIDRSRLEQISEKG